MSYRNSKQLQLEAYQKEQEVAKEMQENNKPINWLRVLSDREDRAKKLIFGGLSILGPSDAIYTLADGIENMIQDNDVARKNGRVKWDAIVDQLRAVSTLADPDGPSILHLKGGIDG